MMFVTYFTEGSRPFIDADHHKVLYQSVIKVESSIFYLLEEKETSVKMDNKQSNASPMIGSQHIYSDGYGK